MNKDRMSSSKRLKLIVILGSLAALGPLSIDMYLPSLPTISLYFCEKPRVLI
ncbi:hypothetical protein MHI37_03390 [Paenibacillus sp. FSL H8-0548]|uniref:multidrug effflux MFS transporter n=1 Tax=Paenibacillus sp. FSL H8-0548 TaxID=1920422 RepID=UPI00117FDA41|nr:multidrug effflux MFS transporter [Paenibacillus sp. FSL H8-0548]